MSKGKEKGKRNIAGNKAIWVRDEGREKQTMAPWAVKQNGKMGRKRRSTFCGPGNTPHQFIGFSHMASGKGIIVAILQRWKPSPREVSDLAKVNDTAGK